MQVQWQHPARGRPAQSHLCTACDDRYQSRRACCATSQACDLTGPMLDERRSLMHFHTLTHAASECKAQLLQTLSGRGLAACQSLQTGEIALQLPHSLALTVPDRHSNIYRWEIERLEPWEFAHGALPAALAYYIADADEPSAVRLAAWVLYLRSRCRQQHRSDIWLSWLHLLPQPLSITSPGCWTRQELQQLQMEPLQAVFDVDDAALKTCAAAAFAAFPQQIPGVQLADAVSDVIWALQVVNTRSLAGPNFLGIYPLHDLLNHSDDPNCSAQLTADSYVIKASRPVTAGAELTISYSPPGGITSLDFLTSWGFTCGWQQHDLALPLIVHALPPIGWDVAVAAAAAVSQAVTTTPAAVAAAPRQPDSELQSDNSQVDWQMFAALDTDQWQTLLLAALSSLPLQKPVASSNAGTKPSFNKPNCSSPMLYTAAAQLLQQFGCCCDTRHLHDLLQQHGQDQQQQMSVQQHDADGLGQLHAVLQEKCLLKLLCAYEHPEPELRAALKAAVVDLRSAVPGQGLPATSVQGGGSIKDSTAGDLALQHHTAVALSNECQGLLLQCKTTIDDDQQLLAGWLQQKQSESGGSGQELAAYGSHTTAEDNAAGPLPVLLQEFQTLQTDVMRELMTLQAFHIVQSSTSSSSGGGSDRDHLIASSFITGAALRVIEALQVSDASGWSCHAAEFQQRQQRLLQHVAQMQLRQATIMQQMRHWQGSKAGTQQQRRQWQQENISVVQEASPCELLPAIARCQAAVAARLQRKQLLLVTGHVCQAAAELCLERSQDLQPEEAFE